MNRSDHAAAAIHAFPRKEVIRKLQNLLGRMNLHRTEIIPFVAWTQSIDPDRVHVLEELSISELCSAYIRTSPELINRWRNSIGAPPVTNPLED